MQPFNLSIKLLNNSKFIEKNDIKQVLSSKIYLSKNKLNPNGLFSEEIFGRYGSPDRRRTYGYIDLKTNIIHPEAWEIVLGCDPRIKKLITEVANYKLTDDGDLIEFSDSTKTGLLYFTEICKKINYNKMKNKSHAKFIQDNLDTIIIDKILVLPAGIRDVIISKTTNKMMIQYSDIVNLYSRLLYICSNISSSLPLEILRSLTMSVQKICLEIRDWIHSKLGGKQGLMRGNLLKKRVDYSADLVVKPDPKLPLGYVGIPWQILLKLYQLFVIHRIMYKDKDVLPLLQSQLQLDREVDVEDIMNYFKILVFNPDNIVPQLKDRLIEILEDVVKDKAILYKRDPVENRDSILAASTKVYPTGFGATLNPLDLPRTGGDCDGDTYKFFPVFTKEANEQAKKKFHPRYSKSIWTTVGSINNFPYTIELNAATAIYRATKQ
jgi:DNA-directed RNA polymerase beta' subunit